MMVNQNLDQGQDLDPNAGPIQGVKVVPDLDQTPGHLQRVPCVPAELEEINPDQGNLKFIIRGNT